MLKWRTVEALIRRHIDAHGLAAGAPLPSDREFASIARCSIQPVIRAMEELARRGRVRRRRGGTTLVAEDVLAVDESEFSFSHGVRQTYGQSLENRVLEAILRPPIDDPARAFEQQARNYLGLRGGEGFYVIARLRLINGKPRALHRSYLNPAHFPRGFLGHDFAKESLIRVINANGYQVDRRRTELHARLPTHEEEATLGIEGLPVLEARQELEAIQMDTGTLVPIEFMQACYVDWRYRIANRREGSGNYIATIMDGHDHEQLQQTPAETPD